MTGKSRLVVHVVESAAGGVRRHLLDLVAGLRELGFEQVVVFSPAGADSGFIAGVTGLGARGLRFIQCDMPHAVGWGDFAAIARLRRVFRSLRPGIIHLHSSKAGGLGRVAGLVSVDAPVVYTPHATGAHRGRLYAVAEWLLGWLRTDACIATSPSEVDDLRRFGVAPRGKIRQVTNGIDAADFRRRSMATRAAPVDVLVCGRITAQKDPVTAARAAAFLVAQRAATTFRWVGDGDLRSTFECELRKLGIQDRWEVTGWLDDVSSHIAASRILWLPSRYESFGYVTLEGMALGVPTVGTRVAGTRDLIADGVNGFLVPIGDAAAIASHTLRVLHDPQMHDRLAVAARARADELSAERMVAETAAVYREVADAA